MYTIYTTISSWIIPYSILIILGACTGSFLSLIYFRTAYSNSRNTRRSILIDRSRCQHSKKALCRYELIPIISFLVQKGESRHTGKTISRIYLANEITLAILRCSIYARAWYLGLEITETIFHLITRSLLVQLIRYDIQHQYLHMPIWIITSIRVSIYTVFFHYNQLELYLVILTIVLVAFTILYYLAAKYAQYRYPGQREGIGEGDLRLAWLIALILPYTIIYHNLSTHMVDIIMLILYRLIIASIISLIYTGWYYLIHKKLVRHIPFFPGLILAAAYLVFLWLPL